MQTKCRNFAIESAKKRHPTFSVNGEVPRPREEERVGPAGGGRAEEEAGQGEKGASESSWKNPKFDLTPS